MEKQGKSSKSLIIGIIAAVVVLAAVLALVLTQCTGGSEPSNTTPTDNGGESTVPVEETYDLYWNVDRKDYIPDADSEAGLTLREPAADGYYHVIFVHEGEQMDLPVLDRKTLLKADSTDLMQLVFNEEGVVVDVIFLDKLPLEVIGDKWYIQSMGGTTVKINSSKNFDGMDETFKTNDETVIYDMSGMSEYVGATAGLQREDRIITIANSDGKVTHVFIVEREGIKEYEMRYCEKCEAEVEWENWFTGDKLPNSNGHYWLDRDIQMSNTCQLKEGHKVCLDLNGHTVTGRNNWRVITTFNAGTELALFDTSEEKTGTIKAVGGNMDQGCCVWGRYGIIDIYGGTYDASEVTSMFGACIQLANGAYMNIHDGKFIGGTCKPMEGKGGNKQGATIHSQGNLNIYNGEFIGGSATGLGGNVALQGPGVTNIYGGVFRGGVAKGTNGGCLSTLGDNCVLNIYGGTITGGKAYANEKGSNGAGGNCYFGAGSTVNIYGGTIIGGTEYSYDGKPIESDYRANIFGVNSVINVYGGRIYGKVGCVDTSKTDKYTTTVYVTGNAKIYGAGEGRSNLSLNSGMKFKVGTLSGNAKISVGVGPGPFSDPVKEGTEKFFVADKSRYQIIRDEEGRLSAYFDAEAFVVEHCICGDPNGVGTACADAGHKQEKWYLWTDRGAAPYANGFWYLDEDLVLGGGAHSYDDSFSTFTGIIGYNAAATDVNQVVVDLNGYTIKGVSGHRLFRMEPNGQNTLIITDTSAAKTGKLLPQSATGNANQGMAIWQRSSTNKLYFYNGTIDLTSAYLPEKADGVGLVLYGENRFYGGTIIGSTCDTQAGALRISSGKTYIDGDFTLISKNGRTDNMVTSGKALIIEGGKLNIDSLLLGSAGRLVINDLDPASVIKVDALTYGRISSDAYPQYLSNVVASKPGDSVKLNDDGSLALCGPNDEGLNDEGPHPSHCVCGGKDEDCALDEHSKLAGEWFPWDGKSNIAEGGNYYLTQDMTGSTQYWMGGTYQNTTEMTINLCLNGHSIDSNYRVFGVAPYVTFNIMNCSDTEAVLTGCCSNNDSGRVLHIHASTATVNMYDNIKLVGKVVEGRSVKNGGAINNAGTFNMYGGTIVGAPVGNTADNRGNGGVIFSGNVNIYDGILYGSYAADGGVIYTGGAVNIEGGTIYAGQATFGGGAIKLSGGSIKMLGGVIDGQNPMLPEITYNAGPAGGGGIMLWSARMTLGGDAVIQNCYSTANGGGIIVANASAELTVQGEPTVIANGKGTTETSELNNIFIYNGTELFNKELGENAKLGLTMEVPGVFTKLVATEANIPNFISDKAGYEVKMTTSSTLALVAEGTTGDIVDPNPPSEDDLGPQEPDNDATHTAHCFCGGADEESGCEHVALTDWKAMPNGGTISTSGNYYLTGPITKNLTISGDVTVNICLNGQNITVSDWRAIRTAGNAVVNISNCKDTELGGNIRAVGSTGDHSGVIMVGDSSTVNIYDNVTLHKFGREVTSYGGIVNVSGDATFNMYGGAIEGCKVSSTGGAVNVLGAFNMFDGTISGGEAAGGGNIYVNGKTAKFTMTGGLVENGVSTGAHGGNISAVYSGSVEITGGIVQNGIAQPAEGASGNDAKDKNGGNISISDTDKADPIGSIVIGGDAQILGGKGDRGGNIFVHTGHLVIKDEAVVTGGKALNQGYGGGADCIHINSTVPTNGHTVTVSGKATIEGIYVPTTLALITEGLTKDASIGIGLGDGTKSGVFTDVVDAELLDAFTSLNEAFEVVQTAEGKLMLIASGSNPGEDPDEPEQPAEHQDHCICGGTDTHSGCDHTALGEWKAWDGKSDITESGNYYLTQSIGYSEGGQRWLGKLGDADGIKINLCLHGHDMVAPARALALGQGVSVNLMNCSENEAVITAYGKTDDHSAVMLMQANTTLNIYDNIKMGVATDSGATITGFAVTNVPSGATLKLYGSKFIGHNVTGNAGAFAVSAGGTMEIFDGEIVGATAASGGSIYVLGTLKIHGGTISGGTAGWGGNLVAAGAGVIEMDGGLVTGGTATSKNDHGGNIYVYNGGTFTMTGGEMTKGQTTGTGDANGGNIAMSNNATTTSTVTIAGNAKVTQGTANRGANVFFHSGNLTIGGNAYIDSGILRTGQDSTNGGYAPGVLINNSTKAGTFTLTGDPTIEHLHIHHNPNMNVVDLGEQAKINITANKPIVLSTSTVDEARLQNFTAIVGTYVLGLNAEGKLEITEKAVVTHCLCGAETELDKHCEICNSDVLTWEPWTVTDTLPYLPGNWYLTSDMMLTGKHHEYEPGFKTSTAIIGYTAEVSTAQILADVVVNVDLNGRIVRGQAGHRVYRMEPSDYTRTLNLTDTSPFESGVIYAYSNGETANQGMLFWQRKANQSVNIYKGTYDASNVVTRNPNGGTGSTGFDGYNLNMFGGTLVGGKVQGGIGGAAKVYGTLNMSGDAVIKNGIAVSGGNVALASTGATLNMSGNAVITGGYGNGSGGFGGGGVTLSGTNTKLFMSGNAQITGNRAKEGSGVLAATATATITVSENARIYGNETNNVYLIDGVKISVGMEGLNPTTPETDGALIGITAQNPAAKLPVVNAENLTAETVSCFFYDDEAWTLSLEAEGLCLRNAGEVWHCVCGNPADLNPANTCAAAGHVSVEWQPWTEKNTLPFLPGYWYLPEDLDLTNANYKYGNNFSTATAVIGMAATVENGSYAAYGEKVDVYVDLNGKTVTGKSGHRLYRLEPDFAHTLSICDSVGTGKLLAVSPANNGNQGMGIWMRGANNVVNFYSGTLDASRAVVMSGISNNAATQKGGAAIEMVGKLNIFGGTIIGGRAVPNNTSGVTGNTKYFGGSIYAGGTAEINMYDGRLLPKNHTENMAYRGGIIYLSGTAKFYMHGGYIEAGNVNDFGGAIGMDNKNGLIHMYAGTISAQYEEDGVMKRARAGAGPAIGMWNGNFVMEGGIIIGGQAVGHGGGAVAIHGGIGNALMTMSGGIIRDGLVESTRNDEPGIGGGNIRIHTGAIVTITGGEVINGVSNRRAGNIMIAETGKLILGGDALIYGGQLSDHTDSNILLEAPAAIEIAEGGLKNGFEAYISMTTPGNITSNVVPSRFVGNFYSDNLDYEVVANDDGTIKLVPVE